jgi:hypothetical protein
LLTADESLPVARADRPWLVMVAREHVRVLREFLDRHALLRDAVFKQRPRRPVGQSLLSFPP